MAVKCVKCGGLTISYFRCPNCGEVRCPKNTCKGDTGKLGRGGANVACHKCGKAKYKQEKA